MHKKVNILLFIVGAILSIFGGVFEFSSSFIELNTLILILLGIFIGLLNIEVDEEAGFLLSALVFLFSVFFVTPYMNDYHLLTNISSILVNFAILTSSATVIVSLRWVLSFTSNVKKIEESTEERLKDFVKFEKHWSIVMMVAIAIVLIEVIFESFFNTTNYQNIIEILDMFILFIFVIDLIILYIEAKSFTKFLKTSWLDIIATIPFNIFFRIFKVVRVFRVFKILVRTHKVSRVNRALKFFSKKSKFNKYIDNDKKE